LRKEKIRIYEWIYQIKNGEVRIFDQKYKQFVNTSKVKEELIDESNRFEL